MQKVYILLFTFLTVVTLSSCKEDETITDLQSTIDILQAQLNEDNTSIEDLESAIDVLDDSVNQMESNLDSDELKNAALNNELKILSEEMVVVFEDLRIAMNLVNEGLNEYEDHCGGISVESIPLCVATEDIADLLDLLEQLELFEIPVIYGDTEYILNINEELVHNLSVFDIQDGEIPETLVMKSLGSFDKVGLYEIIFEAIDSDGNTGVLVITVEVIEE